MKVLIDPATNTIHGVYEEPLLFDISGHYVIDIPPQIGTVSPNTDNSISDLITQKSNAWAVFFTSQNIPFPNVISDELISSPNVDSVNSSGIELGPNKRTVIYPGGTLLTNPISIAAGAHQTCLHYGGFSLFRSPVDVQNPTSPTPISKLLYGYNPSTSSFENFDNATFSVSVCQSTGPFADIATPTPDSAVPTNITYPATFRLKFINNSTIPYHVSDWYLIYG
jgi:hypothetical protein